MSTKPQNDEIKKADTKMTGPEKKELGDDQLASIAAGSGGVIAASSHGRAVDANREAEAQTVIARRFI